MASPVTNDYYFPYVPPPGPSHPVPPAPVHPVGPPPPSAKPPSPSRHVPPPPVHPVTPPPPHILPPPPPSSPDHHPTIIIIVFVSFGGLFLVACAMVALCCFIKKKKKKSAQETDIIHRDEHLKIKETIVPGPHGTQAVLLSIEDDIHVEEEIKKKQQVCGFMKKKKKNAVQETDILSSDNHMRTNEAISKGPHGAEAVAISMEDDAHVKEQIMKNEQFSGFGKKKTVQETENLNLDEHMKVKEAISKGPHGAEAVAIAMEDDAHVKEQIRKNEQFGGFGKKKRTVQETENVNLDEHIKVNEAIAEGPHGEEAVALSMEGDVHFKEDIKKNEQFGEGMHVKSGDMVASDPHQFVGEASSSGSDHHHHLRGSTTLPLIQSVIKARK